MSWTFLLAALVSAALLVYLLAALLYPEKLS
jgi:K+-transporting ATPase KdpF subunit